MRSLALLAMIAFSALQSCTRAIARTVANDAQCKISPVGVIHPHLADGRNFYLQPLTAAVRSGRLIVRGQYTLIENGKRPEPAMIDGRRAVGALIDPDGKVVLIAPPEGEREPQKYPPHFQ